MPPDRDLERELRDLGSHLEYPPVPDLARSVRDRLEAEAGDAGPSARYRPQLWWIAAAALLLLVGVPIFSLAMRDTVGGAFSAGGGVAEQEAAPSSMADESEVSDASGSPAAACGSPEPILEARPARGAPGDEFGIRGRYFIAGFSACDDTGSGSPAAQTVPARDVRVEFLQDGRNWDLGSVVADKGSRIASKLEVPADARFGRATVRATYGQGPPEAPHGRASAEARFFVKE